MIVAANRVDSCPFKRNFFNKDKYRLWVCVFNRMFCAFM